jgi:alpha-N-arabinofuranosidase
LKDTRSTKGGSGRIQLALSDIGRAALDIGAIPIQLDLACSISGMVRRSGYRTSICSLRQLLFKRLGPRGNLFPESQMATVLADILNELEYCMGGTSIRYLALRAEHRHPNHSRSNTLRSATRTGSAGPTFINSQFSTKPPSRHILKLHLSQPLSEATPRTITLFQFRLVVCGEHINTRRLHSSWSNSTTGTIGKKRQTTKTLQSLESISHSRRILSTGPSTIRSRIHTTLDTQTCWGAIAESVYLIGTDRNPNVPKITAYAPSFQNLNWLNWDPNLIAFTANYDQTVLSVSYYSQQMFAHHRGTETLPAATVGGSFNPLWWVATIGGAKERDVLQSCEFG